MIDYALEAFNEYGPCGSGFGSGDSAMEAFESAHESGNFSFTSVYAPNEYVVIIATSSNGLRIKFQVAIL